MKTVFFEKIKTESVRILSPKHGMLNMATITDKKCKELWDEGFTFLALTKKGAAHYFSKSKPTGLVKLIDIAKCKQDVNALLSVSDDKAVKTAATDRIKFLSC